MMVDDGLVVVGRPEGRSVEYAIRGGVRLPDQQALFFANVAARRLMCGEAGVTADSSSSARAAPFRWGL